MATIFSISNYILVVGRHIGEGKQLSGFGISLALKDTLKSFEKLFLLITSCARSLVYGREITTYDEIVPDWFLLNSTLAQFM